MIEIKREFFENGNIKNETPYKDGVINGIEKHYDMQGNLKDEIPYKNGIIDGIEKHYEINGIIDCIREWKQGKAVRETFFDCFGKIYCERTIQGEKCSRTHYYIYHINGKIKRETHYTCYENHIKQGISKEYHADGKLKEITHYKDNKKNGLNIKYYINGRVENNYQNGKITNQKGIFNNENLKWETPYKDGVIDGIEKHYDMQGNLKSEIPYENGIRQGIAREYSQTKEIKVINETLYKDGKAMKNKLKVIKIKLKERNQVDVNINPKMWGYLYNLSINHLKEDLFKLTNEYIIIGIYFGDFKTQREAKEFHNTILKNPKAFLEFDYKQRKILLNGKECCYFFRFYHNACDDLKQTKLTTSIDRQLLIKIDDLFWNEKNKGKEDLGFDFFYMQIKNITLKQVKSITNAKAKERNTEANGGEIGEEFFGLDNVAYYFEIGDNEKIEIPKYYSTATTK